MSFLTEVLASIEGRVERLQEVGRDRLEAFAAEEPGTLSLRAALLSAPAPAIVAEVKRATPREGVLAESLDARDQAAAYAAGGAAAVSVLTEPQWFLGHVDDVQACKDAGPPVLRKDFILDPLQVLESRAIGADALLLIARLLGPQDLAELLTLTRSLGMEALVEVFDERDLELALGAGASLVGVNHRDLETFEVDTGRTAKLAPLMPAEVTLVALSGVSTRSHVEDLVAAGADAVLVGSSLVTAADPAAKLRELRGR